MDIILKGFITGLLLSIFVGATFFMLIETSMTRGFKAGLWFDAGAVLSDTFIITSAYFFTSWITKTIIQNQYFNIAGGTIFIIFGISYIFSRHRNTSSTIDLKNRNVRLFLNGFAINSMNPSVILFWLGTMAFTLSKLKYSGKEVFFYYFTALVTMITIDVMKAYFAYRISKLINEKILRFFYILSAILMISIGLYFIFKK